MMKRTSKKVITHCIACFRIIICLQAKKIVAVLTRKTYRGAKVQLYVLLTSTLDGSKWLASGPGCFIPGEDTAVPTESEDAWPSEMM